MGLPMAFLPLFLLLLATLQPAESSEKVTYSMKRVVHKPFEKRDGIRLVHQVPLDEKAHGGVWQLAYYYINVDVGTPPQSVSVILDTGSNLFAFPCSPDCTYECGDHINTPFDPTQSSTAQELGCNDSQCHTRCSRSSQCMFEVYYLEGSEIHGYMLEDDVTVGDASTRMVVGCEGEVTELFRDQLADGILGLGYRPWPDDPPSFLDNLAADGNPDVFSICFGPFGGDVTFGGYLSHQSQVQWLELMNELDYVVKGKRVGVGSKSYRRKVEWIVDSGSTLTYIPPRLFKKVAKQIRRAVNDSPFEYIFDADDYLWSYEGDDIVADTAKYFPDITIELTEGVKLNVTPQQYVEVDEEYGYVILRIYANENDRQGFIGANGMVGHEFIFDRENGKLGIATRDCGSSDAENLPDPV